MSLPTAHPAPPQTPPTPFIFDPIEDAVAAVKRGGFVVVMDDESRENEGDLVCAAESVTVEGMAWMIKWTSGFICISLPAPLLRALDLPPLLPPSGNSQDPKGTAYHLTLDAAGAIGEGASSAGKRHPVSTGISAHDRAYAARLLARASRQAQLHGEGSVQGTQATSGAGASGEQEDIVTRDDFTRPGHMVTLRYTAGGVRERRGHTECAVDLCYLADLPPAGLLCELVHPTDPLGGMARRDDCWRFARAWGLKIVSVEGLAEYVRGAQGARVPEALAAATAGRRA